ncbi:MAG: Asp23/Gls24 family envelope stress response protein [Christensenellaceae bacterium]|nr:Asp23/Gls24 family envelope stress response protein [Christensenellaceae bacterium]
MDTILHFEKDKYIGKTRFGIKILREAVSLAIEEVAGIARGQKRAIKIIDDEVGFRVNISVVIEKGKTVADISYKVQESVINAIHQLVDKKVLAVNVTIAGVTNE